MRKLLSLSLLLAVSIAAHAQKVSPDVSIQIQPLSGAGAFCLDAHQNISKNGIPVIVYQCHGVPNQRWTITTSEDNRHAIVGIGGYCLDVRGSNSTQNGTPVQLWKCHFGDNQRFSLSDDGRIREVRSGKCLVAAAAVNEAPLVLSTCTNIPGEIFITSH